MEKTKKEIALNLIKAGLNNETISEYRPNRNPQEKTIRT